LKPDPLSWQSTASGADPAAPRQRIDRWLWCARFFKTRSLAAKYVATGRLRVNGTRISKAAHKVKPNDVLTFPVANRVRVVVVLGCIDRRSSAQVAATLFDDQSPPMPAADKRTPASSRTRPANPAPASAPDSRHRARLRRLKSRP